PNYTAAAGYDLVTGLGSPYANRVVADLVGQSSSSPAATHFSISLPASTSAGSGFTLTVTALDANGNQVPSYRGTVHFTASDASAVLPANYLFTSSDNGSHSFSMTLKSAGNQSVGVTDTSNSSVTASAALTVNPGAANK